MHTLFMPWGPLRLNEAQHAPGILIAKAAHRKTDGERVGGKNCFSQTGLPNTSTISV